jgi:hypothetical protein
MAASRDVTPDPELCSECPARDEPERASVLRVLGVPLIPDNVSFPLLA